MVGTGSLISSSSGLVPGVHNHPHTPAIRHNKVISGVVVESVSVGSPASILLFSYLSSLGVASVAAGVRVLPDLARGINIAVFTPRDAIYSYPLLLVGAIFILVSPGD